MENILKIDINSPIFNEMLTNLDKEIKRVIEKIYDEEFGSGEISLKLALSLPEDHKEYPKKDDLGFNESQVYYYRKPYFKHSISTSLKKQYKKQGEYIEDREVQLVDGQYLLIPVKEPQMSLLDAEEEFLQIKIKRRD
ncbi:hypothetical protein AAK964_10385 [Tissierella praeacuta]|uniref:hypothetical protein n=1 Tax=Tissierella praeacuta TaxID=43131 RepID=UPI0035163D00